ncbi:hypothetical protein MD537_20180, partial [Flavihumibacter sediminis]|nr:hypothetical protein [Flavihumibacter sediminis]
GEDKELKLTLRPVEQEFEQKTKRGLPLASPLLPVYINEFIATQPPAEPPGWQIPFSGCRSVRYDSETREKSQSK